MNRKFLVIGAAVLVALIGVRLYQEWPQAEGSGPAPGSFGRSVAAALVQRGPVREAITLVGSLRAEETVDVSPKVSGRVINVVVDLGDAVRTGQLIAELEDDELRQQEQQSEATLSVGRAVVRQRELELQNLLAILDRNRGLAEQGLISAEQFEQAQTRYDVGQAQVNLARAQLTQSEAGLRELRIRIDHTRVTAPISGLVGRRFVDPGAVVNANSPVVTLVKLDTVELIANVPERDMVKLVVGAEGRVLVDALPGSTFTGRVARISPLLDPQTRTAQVEIVVANADGQLRAEMFARVELDLGVSRSVLRVPREALVVRGDRQGVFLIDDKTARFREITVGTSGDDWIEVAEGLAEGDRVASQGANLLRDGDPVRVANEEPAQETSA